MIEKKILFTGGPESGKTSLWKALKDKYPEHGYVPEPARIVIEEERLKEETTPGYIGTFPWNNYKEFGPKVMQKSLELEAEVTTESGIIIQDRSLIDTVAYATINKEEWMLPTLLKHITDAQYSHAIVFDLIPDHDRKHDPNRSETPQERLLTHGQLMVTYMNILGRDNVTYLPASGKENRIVELEHLLELN